MDWSAWGSNVLERAKEATKEASKLTQNVVAEAVAASREALAVEDGEATVEDAEAAAAREAQQFEEMDYDYEYDAPAPTAAPVSAAPVDIMTPEPASAVPGMPVRRAEETHFAALDEEFLMTESPIRNQPSVLDGAAPSVDGAAFFAQQALEEEDSIRPPSADGTAKYPAVAIVAATPEPVLEEAATPSAAELSAMQAQIAQLQARVAQAESERDDATEAMQMALEDMDEAPDAGAIAGRARREAEEEHAMIIQALRDQVEASVPRADHRSALAAMQEQLDVALPRSEHAAAVEQLQAQLVDSVSIEEHHAAVAAVQDAVETRIAEATLGLEGQLQDRDNTLEQTQLQLVQARADAQREISELLAQLEGKNFSHVRTGIRQAMCLV